MFFFNFVRIFKKPFPSKLVFPSPTTDHTCSSVVDSDGCKKNLSLSKEEINQRLKDVFVYRVADHPRDQGPLPVASFSELRNVVFYFFSESDGQALVSIVNASKENMGRDLQLIRVPLSEIIEVEGDCCTRLVPDLSQVKNALMEMEKAGFNGEKFYGVPVFQSAFLKAMMHGTPNNLQLGFFRKEDLEKALAEKTQMSHTDIQREIIQVIALEDIIQEMKDSSTSQWNDVVLVHPGKQNL